VLSGCPSGVAVALPPPLLRAPVAFTLDAVAFPLAVVPVVTIVVVVLLLFLGVGEDVGGAALLLARRPDAGVAVPGPPRFSCACVHNGHGETEAHAQRTR